MPELPEVETVRRGLEQWAVGRTVARVDVFGPRTLRRHVAGAADFAGRLAGQRFEAVCRRGKYLWLPLDATLQGGGANLVAHLGMSGQFLAVTAGTADQPHLRARFVFADGEPEIRFLDQRTFGGLLLDESVPSPYGPVPACVAGIALDPLDAAFDRDILWAAFRRRRTGVKRALLDQSLISGVGNIYADEALWHARLHYARGTETLRRNEFDRLLDAVDDVLRAAIAAGGTSFDALYVGIDGESGWFERSLEVYGREGEPCSRCGAPIRREAFMNRSSYRCPRCQLPPRSGKKVTQPRSRK